MATITTVTRTDDIDGTADAGEVSFALDGIPYVIDLSAENADTLRDFLATYIQHGRRVGGPPVRVRRRDKSPEGERRRAIRAWAIAEGHMAPDARGRTPRHVVDLYDAAH